MSRIISSSAHPLPDSSNGDLRISIAHATRAGLPSTIDTNWDAVLHPSTTRSLEIHLFITLSTNALQVAMNNIASYQVFGLHDHE